MRIILKTLTLVWVLSLILGTKVLAADLTVDCSSDNCQKTGIDPLFSTKIDGYWFPGRLLTKTVLFKNSSRKTKLIVIKPTRSSLPGVLEKVMRLSIIDRKGVVWTGSLANFYETFKINLDNFNPGQALSYDFNLSLDRDLGNEYTNLQTAFDLEMGFWEETVLGEKTQELPVPSFFRWWYLLLPFPLLVLFSLLRRR